jgi:hypothetical protein
MDTAPGDRRIIVYSPKYDEQFVVFLGINPDDGDRKWVIARSQDVTFVVNDPACWIDCPERPDLALITSMSAPKGNA